MSLRAGDALAAALFVAGATAAQADMTIYDHRGFEGSSKVVTDDVADLDDIGFNNKVSAVVIRSGTWTFYRDDNYEGENVTLGPGQYPNLEDVGFPRNKLSSIRAATNGSGTDDSSLQPIPGDDDANGSGGGQPPDGGGAGSLAAIGGCADGQVLAPLLDQGQGLSYVCMPMADAPRVKVAGVAAGQCVDVGANQAGHRIRLLPCADTRQQGLGLAGSTGAADGDFMLFAYADKCVSAAAGSAGAPVGLQLCTGSASQIWTPVHGTGAGTSLVGANDLCLAAVPTGDGAFGMALAACADTPRQSWLIRVDSRGPQP